MSHGYYYVFWHNYLCHHRTLHIDHYLSSAPGGHYRKKYHYVVDLSCHTNSVVRQILLLGHELL
jgi:hypothetical protein